MDTNVEELFGTVVDDDFDSDLCDECGEHPDDCECDADDDEDGGEA